MTFLSFCIEYPSCLGYSSCFLPLKVSRSWQTAKANCGLISANSHLAVPNSCAEMLSIFNLNLVPYSKNLLWLGCTTGNFTNYRYEITCLKNNSYWNVSSASGTGYWRK